MLYERAVWTTAVDLVAEHGLDATVRRAEERAFELSHRDDDHGLCHWLRVMKAASELVREPEGHERLH